MTVISTDLHGRSTVVTNQSRHGQYTTPLYDHGPSASSAVSDWPDYETVPKNGSSPGWSMRKSQDKSAATSQASYLCLSMCMHVCLDSLRGVQVMRASAPVDRDGKKKRDKHEGWKDEVERRRGKMRKKAMESDKAV